MSEKIESALTPEEWEQVRWAFDEGLSLQGILAGYDDLHEPLESAAAKVVAAANFLLPDTDPRKITREHIRACRRELNDWIEDRDAILRQLAAALESYLPPANDKEKGR